MAIVIKFQKLGRPEVLKVEDWKPPALQKGAILMDVAAFVSGEQVGKSIVKVAA